MTRYHSLSPETFTALASGAGGPEAIDRLTEAQVSKHLLLIGHLLDNWPDDLPGRAEVTATLERVRWAAPDRFREVIGAPLVGSWTGIATRAIEHGSAAPVDFQHLGALAVTACASAGIDGSADAPVYHGAIVLPGRGALEVPEAARAEAFVEGGHLRVRVWTPDGEETLDLAGEGWHPVRALRAEAGGLAITLGLDDVHPYRHGHHAPPANRLPDAEVALWQEAFARAWSLLAELVPARAGELAAGLRTLVPLVQEDARTARSATIRHAFGVFGLTLPPSPEEFAVTMVHEFQHSKLSALLDLIPLTDPRHERRYFAPWRLDPRPLPGLLQGVYAFVGVADTWRALRRAPGMAELAERRFVESRLQVDRGLRSIEESGAVTPAGARLIAELRKTTDEMLAEVAPADLVRTAEDDLHRVHEAWRERNRATASA
ncbi:HEXXH motif domain-containing protein [Actinoplanes subtropicus]|uniref:HEXXH motif domain-containing protein n=1 Tax=Actinoplanes subtropicus TaxID=543632 RepID=UPI0004C39B89|nr:HEXXH motif domain-containing protein [Actinoplanes subtropicus]